MKGILIALMAILLLGILIANFPVTLVSATGTTDTQSTTSNVTVNVYISISLTTPAFSGGVMYGNLNPGDTNSASTTCAALACNVTVGADSNVGVDIVMKDNNDMKRGANAETIPNANYVWNSTAGTSQPTSSGAFTISTAYDGVNKVGSNVAASAKRTWQGFLSIPAGQTPGAYNNSLSFCGEQTGQSNC